VLALVQSGRPINPIGVDGWRSREFASGTSSDAVTRRIDVGYPEDRDEAEERLQEKEEKAAAAEAE